MKGIVYLVGAGPGDPELLTVKAVRVLQTAEAVLYDDLVSPEILQVVPATARLHNVGKRCGRKKIRQEEIHFLMIALASAGLRVVRLKSGDPLMFGRAGEEIEALRREKIPYEIVPGVTAAFGAAAAAGVPLTHRRLSSAVVFLTAHQAPENEAEDWNKYVASGATLVIYMPGAHYVDLARRLHFAGLSQDMPCAIVSHATTAQQQIHQTTISGLRESPALAAPSLLIVGEVVGLAQYQTLASDFWASGWADSSATENEVFVQAGEADKG